jgi:mannobiose 2-epimerase
MEKIMIPDLQEYSSELQRELQEILTYWSRYSVDGEHGGFYGKVDIQNNPCPASPKGLVLNSRILWTFASAYNRIRNEKYLKLAQRAYHYIMKHFKDSQYGGFYWSVDQAGVRLNDRKQIYGLAFCLYGLSEYYQATQEPAALESCIDLFELIERQSYDRKKKGYFEAYSRDWNLLEDLRLSDKDANERKTMNTQLHIIEAYANLYRIWPEEKLKKQIENLLEIFAHHIVDDKTYHLQLFFEENWKVKSTLISYGHDIEAAWLLQNASESISHPGWMITMRSLAVKIAGAATEGLAPDGGLQYEFENGHMITEKHWWPQAEAMIGFFNAWQLTGDRNQLQHSIDAWQFTKKYLVDHQKGEWFWGVLGNNSLMEGQDKIGFWKCPYHNTRACAQIIDRIKFLSGLPN